MRNPPPTIPAEKRGEHLARLACLYAVTVKSIRRWEKLGAPFATPEQMPAWIAAQRTWAKPKPQKVRVNVDCRQMSEEERHEHRLAQKRASYARRTADPVRREELNAYARQQYAAKHGPSKRVALSGLTPEQKEARALEKRRTARAARLAADPTLADKIRQREADPARVAAKRAWRQAHADDLNARRRQDRQVNQPKYAAWQRDHRQRKRQAKREAVALSEQPSQPTTSHPDNHAK